MRIVVIGEGTAEAAIAAALPGPAPFSPDERAGFRVALHPDRFRAGCAA